MPVSYWENLISWSGNSLVPSSQVCRKPKVGFDFVSVKGVAYCFIIWLSKQLHSMQGWKSYIKMVLIANYSKGKQYGCCSSKILAMYFYSFFRPNINDCFCMKFFSTWRLCLLSWISWNGEVSVKQTRSTRQNSSLQQKKVLP